MASASGENGAAELRPIGGDDLPHVAEFLHDEMNRRIAASTWAMALHPSWPVDSPNHGFMLVANERIVGVQLAFYSRRLIGSRMEPFCNVAAWCVRPEYRSHGVRLLRALLSQTGYTFTDLSPSGSVVPLNKRLKFESIDTDATLVPNLPWPDFTGAARIVTDPASIEASLEEHDRAIYRDHAKACAAHHLVVTRRGRSCYVIFRRDRRRRLPLFASILHVSDRAVFRAACRTVLSHILIRHGIAATFLEHRIVGYRPAWGLRLRVPRAKMYRSHHLRADQIDYLYSELVSIPW